MEQLKRYVVSTTEMVLQTVNSVIWAVDEANARAMVIGLRDDRMQAAGGEIDDEDTEDVHRVVVTVDGVQEIKE